MKGWREREKRKENDGGEDVEKGLWRMEKEKTNI